MTEKEELDQLRKDAAALRSSFMRNKPIMTKALQKAGLPDSWLGGWQEKLDRMTGNTPSTRR